MKRTLCAFLCALLLAASFVAAFAEPSPTPDTAAVEDADEWLFEEDADWQWEDDEVDDSFFDDIDGEDAEFLDEEDMVEDTLLSAMEVYSWFVLQPLDVDPDKPDETGEYYQVLDERFNTMALLREYVATYFSDEIVDTLFAMNVYKEIDGFLYTTTEGRNIDENIGETEFTVVDETSNRITYEVSVNYWKEDGSIQNEVFTYVRELIGDTWRFTTFPFFW